MAIVSANIGLTANYLDTRSVSRIDFIDFLQNIDDDLIKEITYNREGGMSSLIVFIEDELSRYEDDPEESFLEAIDNDLNQVALWLSQQQQCVFESLKRKD